jgi:hypothetical protein
MNLIPSCGPCNHKKRELYEKDGEALFLHAYFDDLPVAHRFLYTHVIVAGGEVMPTYYVDPPVVMRDYLRRRVTTHFDALSLADYYQAEAVNEISERRGRIAAMLEEGMTSADVQAYFQADALSVAADKGWNHWRSSLLDAMAADLDVCAGAWL